MHKIWAFGLTLALAACSGGNRASLSSFNPFNWFRPGAGTVQSLAPARGYARTVETRPLVERLTGAVAERTPTGVIIRATALPPTQGYYDAGLTKEGVDNGTLTLSFRARPPQSAMPAGPAHLRELVAAIYLTRAQAQGLRRVRVQAAGNSRTVRP